MRTGDRQLIKELNVAIVVDAIRRNQPISRADVARTTRLSRATVTGVVQRLVQGGWVVESGNQASARGRRPVLLRLNSGALYCLALKIAPGRVIAGIADLGAHIVATATAELPHGADEVLAVIEACTAAALHQVGIGRDRLVGVGVALPGIVDPHTGRARDAHLLGWSDFPLVERLREHLELPVFAENDANALTLAEWCYGAGRERAHLVVVTVGIGIGAGIVVGGQIYRGALGGAGELGHTTVEPDGPLCSCGRRGCLEAVAGDRGIVAEARAAVATGRIRGLGPGWEGVTREAVVDAALAGDAVAAEVISRAGRRIGLALANVVALLNPEMVVIGGELAVQAGDLLLQPIREMVWQGAFSVLGRDLPILPAALGNDGWLVGAAALVLQEVFRMPVTALERAPSTISFAELMAGPPESREIPGRA